MKQILFIALLITGMVVNAQRNVLPESIKITFEDKYPNAEKVKVNTKKDIYNIRFILNEKTTLAVFEKDGAWVKTETKLKLDDLPSTVVNAIDKKYSKGKCRNIVYYELREGGHFYKVDVDTPSAIFYLEIDPKGKILKTERVEKQEQSSIGSTGSSSDGNGGEE